MGTSLMSSQKKPGLYQVPPKAHCPKSKVQFSQLWDLIETWFFCEDIKDVKAIGLMMMTPPPENTMCKNKNSNFSALGLDRDLGFSRDQKIIVLLLLHTLQLLLLLPTLHLLLLIPT